MNKSISWARQKKNIMTIKKPCSKTELMEWALKHKLDMNNHFKNNGNIIHFNRSELHWEYSDAYNSKVLYPVNLYTLEEI